MIGLLDARGPIAGGGAINWRTDLVLDVISTTAVSAEVCSSEVVGFVQRIHVPSPLVAPEVSINSEPNWSQGVSKMEVVCSNQAPI